MEYRKTPINTVKRGAKKARYDKKTVHAILDAAEICHVTFIVGQKAFVQPVNFGRKGETLFMHGSLQNRMTNALIASEEACLCVTHLDAMKLTRSAFHHSVNYRSAVVFGRVRELKTNEEKLEGLQSIINHFVPGRWGYCRVPNELELQATRVIAIDIETASAKIDNTPSKEEQEDYDLPFWAGIIPIKTVCEYPHPDKMLKEGTPVPQHVLDFYEKNKKGF